MIRLLNNSTLQEIFLTLPIRSLMRCRQVCRLWREIISGHDFTQTYTSQSLEAKKGVIVHTKDQPGSCSKLYFLDRRHEPIPTCIPLRFPLPILKEFNMIGSCNGLLCFSNVENRFIRFVCNPFLAEFILIPIHVCPSGKLISLNTEFGLCPKTQSYKLLEVAKWRLKNEQNGWKYVNEVYVYNFSDSSWKCLDSEPSQWFPEWNVRGSFVSGAFHWVNWMTAYTLCVFDLEDEVFKDMRGPDAVPANGNRFSTGVLGDFLSIMNTNSVYADVWLMKKYGDTDFWEKSFMICLPQITFNMDLVRVLDYQEEDGLFISYDNEFGIYNFEHMVFERVDIDGYRDLWFQVVTHCDTLISPRHLHA